MVNDGSATVDSTRTEPPVGPATPLEDELGIEHRGIEFIPDSERYGKPSDLFWMWGGALFSIEYVVFGALIVSLGLNFWQALVVIVVGNLSYILTGAGSVQGPAAGTTVFTITRAPFGPNPARVLAVFNWVTQLGYETLGLSLIVLAALALAEKAGLGASTGLKILLIAVATAVQLLLPLFGHRAMLRILRLLLVPFAVLFIILAILTLPKVHLGAGAGANWETITIAFALILSSGGLAWPINASDYSRYLPRGSRRSQIIWSVTLGGYIPSTLCALLGAAVATTVSSASDPISGLPHAFAGWFLIPYLIFIIVQLFAINSIDLYSSAVTLQAIGVRVRRLQAVVFDTLMVGVLTAVTIFSQSFNTFLTDFLLFMIIWIAPWVAIFLIDWYLRRGTYSSRSLLDPRAGIYWRKGGIHIPGVVAQAVGMVAAASWLDTTVWRGPLSTATNGADFSIFMGLIVGGVVYYALARRTVPLEARPVEESSDAAIS